MKIVLLAMSATIMLGLSSIAFSQIIQCPGVYSVLPFVKNVQPVPFPQCYYMGESALKSKKNHCKQIKKKLEHRFSKQLKSKTLQNWYCGYFPKLHNNKGPMYTFTFRPL